MKIRTHRFQKTIRKTFITMGIMLVLFVTAGVVYVYISDRSEAKIAAVSDSATDKAPSIPQPLAPGPNTPNGASVQYISSPVSAGANASINVHTGPESACTIAIAYNKVVSKDSGLTPKAADIHGSVSWTWTVDKSAALGKWPVKVTCVRNGKAGYVEGTLEVTR